MSIRILQGDCREMLKSLPDESVHCVVTSPPYFGLRDYGTAKWDGGDPNCDHAAAKRPIGNSPSQKSTLTTNSGRGPLPGDKFSAGSQFGYAQTCECGARRIDSQIGLEPTPDAYVAELVSVFRELRRVLRSDGTVWLNLGDSYASAWACKRRNVIGSGSPDETVERGRMAPGLKEKDLIGIPWAVAFALRADGWWLRQDIIWSKPNPMPESVRDRCCKAHEYLFLLTKSARYHFDAEAIAEDALRAGDIPKGSHKHIAENINGRRFRQELGAHALIPVGETRNKRSVWTIATQPFSEWGETVRRVRVAWDEPCDGKKRTASPDCPVHAGQDRRASNGSGDEHEAFRQPRIGNRDIRPAPGQLDGFAPIETIREQQIDQHNSGLLDRPYSVSATAHNTQSHRTDLALETSPSYTVSDQILPRTPDTLGEPEHFGSAAHMRENSSGQVGMGDNPSSQIDDGSVHTSSEQALFSASHGSNCTCEYYIEKTEKTSHFATFPPALIEPCILAGCPKGGTVLDCFGGAGTTGLVADRLQRNAILVELNPAYAAMAERRIHNDAPLLMEAAE